MGRGVGSEAGDSGKGKGGVKGRRGRWDKGGLWTEKEEHAGWNLREEGEGLLEECVGWQQGREEEKHREG